MADRSAALDEVEMHTIRRRGIGGSDVPAILGISPFRTPSDVFNAKLGLVEFAETEPMRWGKLIEPLIADEYARREGVTVEWPTPGDPRSRFLVHRTQTWRRATIDYVIHGTRRGMDAKMASPFTRERWGTLGTDEIPDEYLVQMLWYIDVTGYELWDVAVLLGNELRIYRVYPHEALQQHLREQCGRFWHEHVLTKQPPPPVNAEDSRRQLNALYPHERTPLRPATAHETRLVAAYARAEAFLTHVEAARDLLKARLSEAIGDATGLEGPWGHITWKRTKDSDVVNWEAVARGLGNLLPDEYKKAIMFQTNTKAGTRRFLPKIDLAQMPLPERDTMEAIEDTVVSLEIEHAAPQEAPQ